MDLFLLVNFKYKILINRNKYLILNLGIFNVLIQSQRINKWLILISKLLQCNLNYPHYKLLIITKLKLATKIINQAIVNKKFKQICSIKIFSKICIFLLQLKFSKKRKGKFLNLLTYDHSLLWYVSCLFYQFNSIRITTL